MTASILLFAAISFGAPGGASVDIDASSEPVDPAKSVFVTLTLKSPKGMEAIPPDLRGRARGFKLAEDFVDELEKGSDGGSVQTVRWRFVPEPCAKSYSIAPFAVEVRGGKSFVAGPVRFASPAPRESVTGPMEVDPKKDLPPMSWKLVGWCAAALLALAVAGVGVWFLARYLLRRVKEHFMSPIERAWAELDRLVKRALPDRGKFKDFYVELTMVVRRYVQRKYGIRAPHLTTEEFFAEISASGADGVASSGLREFLESADLVKFAGVEATKEMANSATDSARTYLKSDSASLAGVN